MKSEERVPRTIQHQENDRDIACGQLLSPGRNNLALYYLSSGPINEQSVRPMAAYYIAADNTVVDWLMDGIIIFDIHLYETLHPQQSTCDAYIKNLFGAGNGNGQIATLDSIIGGLKTQLNAPDYKWKVALSVPYAEDLANGNAVVNCKTLLAAWQSLNPVNLELIGFYWGYTEGLSDRGRINVCKDVAALVHDNGLVYFWIPYYTAPGLSNWASFGFDYTTVQPCYGHNLPRDTNRFATANALIGAHALAGAEMEFADSGNDLDMMRDASDYVDNAEYYRWNNSVLTTWYYGNSFAMFARNGALRGIYDRIYRAISPRVRSQWRFNEKTGNIAHDSSSCQHDATLHGANWTADGIGPALHFDGNNSYMECPAYAGLNVTETITMEAWIKPEILPSSYGCIIGRNACGKRMLLSSSGNIMVQMDGPQQVTTTSPVKTSQWNHVVYASDGINSVIYVNGSAISSGNCGADFSSTAPVRIGLAEGTNYPFKGVIDEVKIYSRALTAAEISMNYWEGLDHLALRGRWSFEEGNAKIITHNNAITCPPDLNIHGATWTKGVSGNALHFAGTNDYVDCGSGGELNVTGAITMEAWIKPEALPSSYGGIIGRNVCGKRMLLSSNGNILVQMDGPQQVTTTSPVKTSQWNHVLYTSDGINSVIYVNGVPVSSGNCGADFSSTAPVRIGLAEGTNYPFKGVIDEVSLFARVLTPAEISARYNAKSLRGQ